MKKRLELVIQDTCDSCPFCICDAHYSMSYDSGYDCDHPDFNHKKHSRRLADDYDFTRYKEQQNIIKNNTKELFPVKIENKDILKYPLNIPESCPLETIN